MRSSLPLALVLVLILGGGMLVLFRRASAARAASEVRAVEWMQVATEARAQLAAGTRPEPEAEPAPPAPAAERAPSPAMENELITEALRAHARASFAQGWADLRQDELPATTGEHLLAEYERAVLAMAYALGRRAAEAQDERELRERAQDLSDAVAWLATVPEHTSELADVARDSERFASFFRPRSSGAAFDGTRLGERDPLPDGAVLQFPAGVYALNDLARGRDPFPRDVTLRGAGMEATLLVVQDLSPRGALERFTVEDCTVFAERCSLADVRAGPTVLSLRRMRLIGFDCGAGGSYALTLSASAISASQCRFEGGYGRNPTGLANLMRRTSPLVARFEGCLFERVSLDGAVQPGVVFSGCVMTDLLEEPGPGPLYDGCRITLLAPESLHDETVRRRELNDLFPDWQARLEKPAVYRKTR